MCIAVTTAINMCARGEVSLLLWGNWTLPPVQEGPPLMRGDPSFAGGELRAALRKASFSSFAITGRTTLPESRSRTENDINLHPSLARGHQYGGVAYDCLLL